MATIRKKGEYHNMSWSDTASRVWDTARVWQFRNYI